MRKILIAAIALLVLLAGAAVAAVWSYDASRNDRLAKGIEIAGVDVGGMKVAHARAVLETRVARPLARPITVSFEHRQFVLSPREAGVQTNVDTLLAQALADSRKGNFFRRAFREVTGGKLDTRVSPEITYSDETVQKFVGAVKLRVDRKPRDAKSSASFAGVRIVPSKAGVAVNAAALRLGIEAVLVDTREPRTFELPVRILRPKVTSARIQKRFRVFIAVSRSRKELRYFVKEKLVKTYRVAIGRIGFETPAGLYEIRTKAVNPAWFVPNEAWAGGLAGKIIPPGDPENPLKARWMGFWDGAGIHGTADSSSIGSAASHGCIRMNVPDVIQLYDRVPLHTPVYIS
jgi:lipoprotein-anchoring transpeptidase ErfK/SrfK